MMMKSRFSALKAFLPHLFYQVEPALGRLRNIHFLIQLPILFLKYSLGYLIVGYPTTGIANNAYNSARNSEGSELTWVTRYRIAIL